MNADIQTGNLLTTTFEGAFGDLQRLVNQLANRNGFWEDDVKENHSKDAEKICLMHSELSEALEAVRSGNGPDDKIPQFSGVEAELADCVIRIMDYAEQRGFNIGAAIVAKHNFNCTRPYKHGKKF